MSTSPPGRSGSSWWRFRIWLSEWLLGLGRRVQPEHRYCSRHLPDGNIVIWAEQP